MRSRLFIKDESNKQTKQQLKKTNLRRETENCFHLTIIMNYTTLKEEEKKTKNKTKQKSIIIIIIITFEFPFSSIYIHF